MLNLPWQGLKKIETYVGIAEGLVRDLEIEEALQNEIKEKLEKNQSYVNWCDLSGKGENKNKVKLTVRYDMGWQWRYESSSGHGFIVGGRSNRIIGMVLYSKAYRKRDAAENRVEEAEEHDCPKNFEGS